MSKPLLHFVITRFNLKRKEEPPAEWLERRVQLFERYCLPSLIAQHNKDFYWLVLFGDSLEDSPEWLRDCIKKWCVECEMLYPLFCGDWRHSTIGGCVEDFIRSRMATEKARHILTTRIDNDDGMHVGFTKDLRIHALSSIALGVDSQILDPQYGVRYHEGKKQFLRWHRRCGPFISLLKKYHPDKKLVTVHSMGAHTEAHKVAPIKAMDPNTLYWLQVLHDTNISNKLKGNEPVIKQKNLKGFDWLELPA